MDELWRKAADEYPLNTGGADWNKLSAKMGIPAGSGRGKDRRYLLLLLLLLLPWMCIEYRRQHGEEAARIARNTPSASAPAAPAAAGKATEVEKENARPASGSAGNAPHGPAAPLETPVAGGRPSHTRVAEPGAAQPARPNDLAKNEATAAAIDRNNATARNSGPRVPGTEAGKAESAPVVLRNMDKKSRSRKPRIGPSAGSLVIATHRNEPKPTGRKTAQDPVAGAAQPIVAPGSLPVAATGEPAPPKEVIPTLNTVSGIPAPDTTASTSATTARSEAVPEAPAAEKPARKRLAARPPRIYVGLLAGAGVTTVRGQAVQRTGKDVGLVLGYTPGRHWALEAGLLWSRKHYYSTGDLVKSDAYPSRNNYILKDVSGDCRMIEIPVTVQYHFGYGARGNWFAAA
ncbi:MAG: hypothetical protein EOO16_18185, partial [Chitinophagaceae bacterium]